MCIIKINENAFKKWRNENKSYNKLKCKCTKFNHGKNIELWIFEFAKHSFKYD